MGENFWVMVDLKLSSSTKLEILFSKLFVKLFKTAFSNAATALPLTVLNHGCPLFQGSSIDFR